jgi:hypothetical protein
MQFWITVALMGWAVLGPFVGGGIAEVRSRLIDIPNARAAAAREAAADEHKRGTAACDARVEGIRQQIAAASEEARKLSEDAANTIGPTPAEKTALQSVCNASTSCRDRK